MLWLVEVYLLKSVCNLFMEIKSIRKRDGSSQAFEIEKIENAILKALRETKEGNLADAKKVAELAHKKTVSLCVQAATAEPGSLLAQKCQDGSPAVEEVQDLVEQSLMELDYFDTAKAYILYRSARNKMRERNLFAPRTNLKPYEYPELYEYVDAIRHSYWVHTEFNFTSDVSDFLSKSTASEKSAIKNAMLAIAQIEVAVKTFWGDVYKHLPKPEIGAVGATFSESEVRHADAYAHLIEILGLNEEFEKLTAVPVIKDRIEYLSQVSELSKGTQREYVYSVMLFSLFIEHVSLFSQFLIIMSFNKYKNMFKGMSNAVEATSKEEQIHGMFGIDLINIIKKENPAWFDDEYQEKLTEACRKAYAAESNIVDWIYEAGDLDFMPKANVKEFIKNRFNNSLASIGLERIFEVNQVLLEETEWFDTEVIATKHVDFFNKRSINYNKRSASVTADDLF